MGDVVGLWQGPNITIPLHRITLCAWVDPDGGFCQASTEGAMLRVYIDARDAGDVPQVILFRVDAGKGLLLALALYYETLT